MKSDQQPFHETLDRLITEYIERIALEERTAAALESGELRSRRNGEDVSRSAIEFHRQGAEAYRGGLEGLKAVRGGWAP